MMSTTVWQGTHPTPIDANAARELSTHRPRLVCSTECPPLCLVPVAEVARRNPSTKFSDLTSERLGAAVVVGLAFWQARGKSIWVVRCGCGRYDTDDWKLLSKRVRRGGDWECSDCHHRRRP